ncbi:autotransporter domain-containing protein [Paraburkholderia sp. BCC1885]|uniref:autotransporter outer membrane beta-barrel domain-containing protein n=1 Tax=Paraburkholderia sp. BCC1885 TaxID=2562669 RepID=UPI001642EC2A|nr:autotransporter domain-containing protein [Paraburkholderia sp. BCC1885]
MLRDTASQAQSLCVAELALLILLSLGAARDAQATDLTSSTTEYILSAGGNPYTVVSGATINTVASGEDAIYGKSTSGWTLTNNGSVTGGFFAVQFGSSFATVVNNGSFLSPNETALALFFGGQVTNAAGAVIAAKLDGVYADSDNSRVVNAGMINGDVFGLADDQSGVHLPLGGSVDNLYGGVIRGYTSGILAAAATTVMNAGVIGSTSGPAIDLTTATGTTGSVVVNSGTIDGGGGIAIQFGPNDDTLQITGTSLIDGIVDGGSHSATGANTLILGGSAPGTFDLSSLGANAQYRNFNALLKQDTSVWTLTGANTAPQDWQISGGTLMVTGQLTGSIAAAPGATGVEVGVGQSGAIRAATGSAVSVGDGSLVTNGGTLANSASGAPAVDAQGAGVGVTNSGSIAASGAHAAGVSITASSGAASLVNQQGATIASNEGVAVAAGSNVSFSNAGTLTGNSIAVSFTGSNDLLTLGTGSVVSGDLSGGNSAGNALVLQGAGTLSSHVYGFPTLTMNGAAWTLAGNAEIGGATLLNTGTLQLDSTMTSPVVTLAPAATLSGTGTVRGALAVQGQITPGDATPPAAAPVNVYAPTPLPLSIGTLGVAGRYTQSAASSYVVEVSPNGNDLIAILGTAALQGGTVIARLRAASFSPSDTYRILSASTGVTGSFASVETLNPFVQPSLVYDADDVYLQVNRSFQNAGGTPNQIAVETALDHGVAGIANHAPPTVDFLTLAADLVSLEGSAAYAALNQLSAEAYAALPNAHFAAAQTDISAIDARLDETHAGRTCAQDASSGLNRAQDGLSRSGDARVCSWAAVLGDTARIGGYDTWLSQQIDLAGAIAGVDYRAAPTLTLGGALAYLHGNTSTDSLPAHGQFDSYQAMLYGSYAPGLYWIDTTLGFARNDDQMKRSILFTDPTRTAQGNTDGSQYFASLRAGLDLPAGAVGVLTPFAALEAQDVELPGLSEAGAGAADLVLPGTSASSVRTLLGTQWRKAVNWAGRQWDFEASAAWAHAYGALTRAVDASFAGASASSFVVHGSGAARDAAQIALSASLAFGQHAHAFLRCNGEFGSHDNALAGALGFSYLW